jgi:hypothetical protein
LSNAADSQQIFEGNFMGKVDRPPKALLICCRFADPNQNKHKVRLHPPAFAGWLTLTYSRTDKTMKVLGLITAAMMALALNVAHASDRDDFLARDAVAEQNGFAENSYRLNIQYCSIVAGVNAFSCGAKTPVQGDLNVNVTRAFLTNVMNSVGCQNLDSGVFRCPSTSYAGKALGGSSIWWGFTVTSAPDIVGNVFVFLANN